MKEREFEQMVEQCYLESQHTLENNKNKKQKIMCQPIKMIHAAFMIGAYWAFAQLGAGVSLKSG